MMAGDDQIREDEIRDEPQEVDLSEATPVCPNCFEPVDPLEHYCSNCGEGSGRLTPYIPFVNIHYNYSIFGRMWQRVWQDEGTSFLSRMFNLLLILVMVPVMLVGLPFMIFRRYFSNSTDRRQNS